MPQRRWRLLSVERLDCHYDQSPALADVSFSVDQGEIVTVIGPNGAGKSTLLRTISGLMRASSGRVVLDGHDVTRTPTETIVRLGLSHVPEGRRLFPGLSVLENLEMGAVSVRGREWRRQLDPVFQLFPILRERQRQMAWSLSGGQQQMLAIGRALMAQPRILLLDEPSIGLAPLLVRDVFRCIVEINRQGTTIILAEQNARAALRIAARGLVLANGRLVLSGEARALAEDDRVRALYLGGDLRQNRPSPCGSPAPGTPPPPLQENTTGNTNTASGR